MKHSNHKLLIESLDKAIKHYAHENSNLGLSREETRLIIKTDIRDLKNILKLMKTGKYQEAYLAGSYLDTIVRDAIPENVWDTLQQSMDWQE